MFSDNFSIRRIGSPNKTRLGDWEGLLLNSLHVALEEIIVERLRGLGGAFQFSQLDLCLIRDLRLGNGTAEAVTEALFPRKSDFVIALVALLDLGHFILDRMLELTHLRAQSDNRQMVGPIFLRVDGHAAR